MSGVWLGVDPGSVRIGLAVSDSEGLLATPLRTVPADTVAVSVICDVVAETDVSLVVVGLPRSLDGTENLAAGKSREFAASLANAVSVPVRLVDERLTTVSAARNLHAAGRRSKRQRSVIDQVAAVELLQSALEQRRNSGDEVGELVRPIKGAP